MPNHHWYVRYPSGKESKLVSIEEARLLVGTYGGSIHQEWWYEEPKGRRFRLPVIVRMFVL